MKIAYSNTPLKQFISALKIAIASNKTVLIFKDKSKQALIIINLLKNAGFLESVESSDNFLVVKLKQTFWKSYSTPLFAIQQIKVHSSTISANSLIKINKYRPWPYCVVLNTDKKIKSSSWLAGKRVGGLNLLGIQ